MKVCKVDGCSNSASGTGSGHGYCNKHLKRWRRHGDPLGGRTPDGEPLAHLRHQILEQTDDCIIWPYSLDSSGYGQVKVGGVPRSVHRYVCELTHGPCPDGMEAAHYCGVRVCFNPRHVRWATPSENQLDRFIHGTHARGSRSPTSKLTEEQVIHIRTMRGELTAASVAGRFGVSDGTIFDIWHGRTWSWL